MHLQLRMMIVLFIGSWTALSFAAGVNTDNEVQYQPGHGWQIPETGLHLGGYGSVNLEKEKHLPAKLSNDDLSLFIWWEGEGKLRLFSELDLENGLIYEHTGGFTTKHAYLALERLYADYNFSEYINLRAGKFLTPIGRWNQIHAAPLVWTTSRPLITERTFPTNATGAMAYGNIPVLGRSIDYSVYTALGEDWRPAPKVDPFEEAYGLRLSTPIANADIGFSYANFEQKNSVGERKNLLGLDFLWASNRYEIMAELAYRFSDRDHQSDEKGLYIQGVAPITDRIYAIARYELYNKAGVNTPTMNLWVAGLAMKLSPAMILKAEFSQATNNQIQAPEGFFSSFAILF